MQAGGDRELGVTGIRWALAALAVGCVMSSANATAAASKSKHTFFTFCDGHGTPRPDNDGLTTDTRSFWLRIPPTPKPGELSEVAACDAALADPRLEPDFWERRISLLLARATFKLRAKDFESALADLDLAETVGADREDPVYRHGLKFAVRVARGYTLRMLDRGRDASELAREAWDLRPYSQEAGVDAFQAIGVNLLQAESEDLLRRLAQTRPDLLDDIYEKLLRERRWAEAEALHPQLRPPLTLRTVRYGGGGVYSYFAPNLEKDTSYRIRRTGQHAYTLAALGRQEESRAVFATVNDMLAAALEPPPRPRPHPKTGKISVAETEAYNAALATRARMKPRAERDIQSWRNLLAWREKAMAGQTREVVAAIGDQGLLRDPVSLDLIDTVIAALPADDNRGRAALVSMRRSAGREQTGPAAPTLHPVLSTIEEVSTSYRRTGYRAASRSIFGSDAGFSVEPSKEIAPHGGEVYVISFRDHEGYPSFAEEMIVLRAAELARSLGKTGMVVLWRERTEHSITSTYYGVPMSTTDDGISVSLKVTFVDIADPPKAFLGATWRIIDARAAHDALAPAFVGRDPKRRKK